MKKLGLASQILIALVLGVIVGALFYQNETVINVLTPIGDIFIHLIKMIVLPIVILCVDCRSSWCWGYENHRTTRWENDSLLRNCDNDCISSRTACSKRLPSWYRN
ncbi:cation:dicarboxylate symporter family transporter [Bacillus sp. SL00103]